MRHGLLDGLRSWCRVSALVLVLLGASAGTPALAQGPLKEGEIVVAEARKVLRIDPASGARTTILDNHLYEIVAVTLSSDGVLVLLERAPDNTWRIARVNPISGVRTQVAGGLFDTSSIARAPTGDYFVVGRLSGVVTRFEPIFPDVWSGSIFGAVQLDPEERAVGITTDAAGRPFVLQENSRVLYWNPADPTPPDNIGEPLEDVPGCVSRSIAFSESDARPYLTVLCPINRPLIASVLPDRSLPTPSGSLLRDPQGIAADAEGFLIVADRVSGILRIDTQEGSEVQVSTGAGAFLPSLAVARIPGLADLQANFVWPLPATVTLGSPQFTFAQVYNVGEWLADRSVLSFYLSLDTTKSASDIRLNGSVMTAPVEVGGPHNFSSNVTVPAGTPAGTYYLIGCIDDTGVVPESAEGNNCAVAPSRTQVQGPDLRVSAVSNPPAGLRSGTSFTVTETVINGGNAGSGVSTTRYFLSTDRIAGGDLVLTGSRSVPALAAAQSSAGSATVTIPLSTSGTFYLLACADSAKQVPELNEANQCAASAATIRVFKF